MASTASKRQSPNHSLLLYYSTLAASFALSVVSGYETYLGLLDFLNPGHLQGKPPTIIVIISSVTLTFGIQVLLFAISWNIANHIRDGFRANATRWAIWALCGIISAFLSYYGFIQTTGGRNEGIRLDALTEARTAIYKVVDEDLRTTLQTDHRTKLVELPAFAEWKTKTLPKLMGIATNGQVMLTQAAQAKRIDLLKRQQDTTALLNPLEAQRRTAKLALERTSGNLEQVQAEIEQENTAVNAKEAEKVDAETALAALQANLATEVKTNRNGKDGPETTKLKNKINTQQGVIDGIDKALNLLQEELAKKLDERDQLDANASDPLKQQQLADLTKQVDALSTELTGIRNQLDASVQNVNFDNTLVQSQLSKALSDLSAGDYTQLRVATDLCNSLKEPMLQTDLKSELTGIECTVPEVSAAVENLKLLKASQEQFAADCMDPAKQTKELQKDPDTGLLLAKPMIDQIAECANFVQSADKREYLDAAVKTLQKQRGDGVDAFQVSVVALLVDHQTNSITSMALAVIVDVLVLLCALIGKTVGLPERVRAIDLLMARSRAIPGGSPVYERQLDLSTLNPHERSLVELVVGEMLRRDLIDYGDGVGDILMLKTGARDRINAIRNQEIGEVTDAPASAPAETQYLWNTPRQPKRPGLKE